MTVNDLGYWSALALALLPSVAVLASLIGGLLLEDWLAARRWRRQQGD